MAQAVGLEPKVFSGVSWLAVAKIINRGLVFITTLILARLLTPSDFGLVAGALVALNFLTLFNESGLSTAIAQAKRLKEEDLSSLFWPNLLVGVLLFGIACLFSSSVALFFGDVQIGPVLVALSFTLVIDSFGLIQAGYLTRLMNFKSLSVREMVASLGYGISAIAGAFLGWGVWSLVVGYLVKSLVGSVALWFSVDWRPRLEFNFATFKRVYVFGFTMVGNSLVEFFRRNTDRGLIGRFLGTSALGVYSIAYNLIMIPRDQITPLATRVLLPAYSKIQGDDKRLENAYLKALEYVALVTVPASFGLAAVAPEFVGVLFGSRWMGAVVPLQLLSVAGALSAINPVVGYVLVAKGKPGIFLLWNVVRTVFTVLFLWVGLKIAGLPGIAAAFSLAVLLDTPVAQYISIRPVGGSLRRLWAVLFPAFEATFLMVAGVTFLRLALLASMVSGPVVLVSCVLFGAIIYLLGLWLAEVETFEQLVKLGLGLVRARFARFARSGGQS